MVDFIYEETIAEMVSNGKLEIISESPLSLIKGLSVEDGRIFINLSAIQWKLRETSIIEEIEKTITHEYIHKILKQYKFNIDGEERVCQIMAGQI